MIFSLSVIGLLAGILGGLFGLGGAIIIIPALVMWLGFSQQVAQGTTLLMMVLPVGALASWQYYKNGYVNISAALVLAVFFFIGGYFGAKMAASIPTLYLKKSFAVLLGLIALKIFFFDKK